MRAMIPTTLTVLLVTILTACHSVELAVHNPQPIDLQAWVEVSDDQGNAQETVELGVVSKQHGQAFNQFTAKPGWSYDVLARVPGSATVYRHGRVTIGDTPDDSKPISIVLDPLAAPLTEITNADTAALSDAAQHHSPVWENFPDLDANEGARRFWGALLMVKLPKEPGQAGRVLYEVPASVFSTVRSIDEFPKNQTGGQAAIYGDSLEKLKEDAPLFASVLGEVDPDDTVSVSWKAQNYGWLTRSDQEDFDVLEAVWALPEATKREIFAVRREHPDASFLYVSQIYVIQQLTVTANRAKRLRQGLEADEHCIVTGEGVFRFDPDDEHVSAQAMKLVNISGVAWQPLFARVNARNNGYEFIEDPRLDLLVDDFVKNRVVLLPHRLTMLGPGQDRFIALPDLKALSNLAQVP